MLSNSILQHGGVLTADKTITFKAATSVLRLEIGDEIKLTKADLARLAKAFFAEIDAKFGS